MLSPKRTRPEANTSPADSNPSEITAAESAFRPIEILAAARLALMKMLARAMRRAIRSGVNGFSFLRLPVRGFRGPVQPLHSNPVFRLRVARPSRAGRRKASYKSGDPG